MTALPRRRDRSHHQSSRTSRSPPRARGPKFTARCPDGKESRLAYVTRPEPTRSIRSTWVLCWSSTPLLPAPRGGATQTTGARPPAPRPAPAVRSALLRGGSPGAPVPAPANRPMIHEEARRPQGRGVRARRPQCGPPARAGPQVKGGPWAGTVQRGRCGAPGVPRPGLPFPPARAARPARPAGGWPLPAVPGRA
jgi:hypothetical protein